MYHFLWDAVIFVNISRDGLGGCIHIPAFFLKCPESLAVARIEKMPLNISVSVRFPKKGKTGDFHAEAAVI